MDQPKIERLLRLMKMLTTNTTYTVDDLADRLGMSRRTVYRYIDTFREAGFVIKKSGEHIRLDKESPHFKDISQLVHFTEEEAAIYRRGRNMGHGNVPKSASVAEYRRATGMEVLFGYLHLTGQSERMNYLFRVGYGLTGSDSVHNSQSGETPT